MLELNSQSHGGSGPGGKPGALAPKALVEGVGTGD
jgi:hypothetical protein